MRVPRWTTYPAIALLLILAVIGLPRRPQGDGAAIRSRSRMGDVERGANADLNSWRGETRSLVEFLPMEHSTDGSVDYRVQLQRAVDACQGSTLELPAYPILVGRTPGKAYGVIIREGMAITGCKGSELRTDETGLQLLRAESVETLLLSSFALVGPGGDGEGLGHGLLQVTGGNEVHVRDLTIRGADADGLAISNVTHVSVEGVVVEGASKSAIYLAQCTDGYVRNNFVSDFGGHRVKSALQNTTKVGVGIQLSSSRNLICSDNVVQRGLGVGILCNAYQGGSKPFGNTIRDNRIQGVANRENRNVSGGIRLANGHEDKFTRTSVTRNSIWNCGANGIYIENHGDSEVTGNLVSSSDEVGILVSSIENVRVTSNVILRSGGSQAFGTINAALGVHFEDNVTDPDQQNLDAVDH